MESKDRNQARAVVLELERTAKGHPEAWTAFENLCRTVRGELQPRELRLWREHQAHFLLQMGVAEDEILEHVSRASNSSDAREEPHLRLANHATVR